MKCFVFYAKYRYIINVCTVVDADKQQLFALIWTTTPWTLPANEAICYGSDLM